VTSEIDLTDVPVVSEIELALPMKVLVDAERSLCLMRGAGVEDRRIVEDEFWKVYTGTPARGVSILLRFWCLVDAFSAKRFKALLLNRGYEVLWAAVAAASGLRLNAHWGFNPQRLIWAIGPAVEVPPPAVGLRKKRPGLGMAKFLEKAAAVA